MSRSLAVGSLFSGIGGFDVAAEYLGMRVAWQVEIDRHARRVLERHFPTVKRYEDIRAVDPIGLEPVDVLCGGWPCQDASIAGKRADLAGERTGLFSEILRLIDGMDTRPPFLCLENVPGLVSVNSGRDFAHCLGELRRRGYVGCVRRLDAQHFGLAQRRQRLFFVAGLGERGLRAVQLVLQGGQRYPAPRRETGAELALDVAASLRHGGGAGRGWQVDAEQGCVVAQCHGNNVGEMGTLRAGNGGLTGGVPFVATEGAGDARALNAKGGSGRMDGESETFLVAKTLTANYGKQVDSSDTNAGPPNIIVAHTLRGEGFDAREPLPFDTTQITSALNYSSPRAGDPCHPLAAQAHPPAIAFTERGREQGRTLEAQEEMAYCLTNPGNGGRTHSRQGLAGCAVRRLTPTECERLMGFSDGWTCLCGRNEGRSVGENPCRCADGPRYRALGNSVAVPCVVWVLRCVLEAEA